MLVKDVPKLNNCWLRRYKSTKSTSVFHELLPLKLEPSKNETLQERPIPDDLKKVTPVKDRPVFENDGIFVSVLPYLKLTRMTVGNRSYPTVLEMFKNKFIGKNISYIQKQIQEMNLWVYKLKKKSKNKHAQTADSYDKITGIPLHSLAVSKGDIVENYACVHELQVPYIPKIEIVYEDKDLIVVNKPSGIPVHSSSTHYHYNTVQYQLAKQIFNAGDLHAFYKKLLPCHRLDKDTSGVLIFAKNKTKCSEMNQLIEHKTCVQKKYISQVHGDFGDRPKHIKGPVITCDLSKKYKDGVSRVVLEGISQFQKTYYDPGSDTSLVECQISTGRRHQIRQHLRNLGFPIVNDPLYGKDGILSKPFTRLPNEPTFNELRNLYLHQLENRRNSWDYDSICTNCSHISYKIPLDGSNDYLRLHSHSYKFTDPETGDTRYHFTTDTPVWAATHLLPA